MHGIIGKQRVATRLYPHQRRALKQVVEQLKAKRRAFFVGPTGVGKTIIFGKFIEAQPKGCRVLIIQDRINLVAQNAAKIAGIIPDKSLVTVCAGLPRRVAFPGKALGAEVVSGTIHSVTALIGELGVFDVLIIDEADLSAADSYLKVCAAMLQANPELAIFGASAVAERADHRGLELIFGNEAIVIELKELLRLGYLVPPVVKYLPLEIIKEQRIAQIGDDGGSLNVKVVHEEVIRNWVRYGQGRQTIMHCQDITHARDQAKAFKDAGIDSAFVSHKTPNSEMIRLLDSFIKGTGPKVLCSASLLIRGYDPPLCSCIVLLRAFSHKSTLIEAVGRGLRLAPGKDDCLVLDFVGAVERHGGDDAFIAGTNLADRRTGGVGGAGVPGFPVPTLFDYGEAELKDFSLGFKFASSLKGTEAAPEQEPLIFDGRYVGRTRAEAIAKGLPTYFTGEPCEKRGHVCERRLTKTGSYCKDCRGPQPENSLKCCAPSCGKLFNGTHAQVQRSKKGIFVFCSKRCRQPVNGRNQNKKPKEHHIEWSKQYYHRKKNDPSSVYFRKEQKIFDLECAWCNKPFKGNRRKLLRSEKGFPVYCSKSHCATATNKRLALDGTRYKRSHPVFGDNRQYHSKKSHKLKEML